MSIIDADNIPLLKILCNSVEKTAFLTDLEIEDSDFWTNLQLGAAISTEPVPALEGHPAIRWSTYGGHMRLQFVTLWPHIVVPYITGTGLRVVSEGSNAFTIEFEISRKGSPQCDFEIYALPSGGSLSTTRMKVILLPKPLPPGRRRARSPPIPTARSRP
ncbi:hypothetical protein SAMN02745121_07916 [Nannocystis exedens]|uniref:Uncharacterized protein n=1 Tax=Nannocystis exedens TaxID=54 RepID=A0A1I2HFU8_9BACT|nr:hypothetical protein [Nannocystis exedens]PCC67881.1 hypothetical protein NAEX_00889 [Nannocystis exedens]SFF28170.1 hypothetical protein SAMN02745121_07916 [Nannocystis exedens]